MGIAMRTALHQGYGVLHGGECNSIWGFPFLDVISTECSVLCPTPVKNYRQLLPFLPFEVVYVTNVAGFGFLCSSFPGDDRMVRKLLFDANITTSVAEYWKREKQKDEDLL